MSVRAGDVFGELTVLRAEPRARGYATCLCSCGNKKEVRCDHLKAGKIISCGHIRNRMSSERQAALAASNVRHGLCGSRAYICWNGMIQRCYNPRSVAYHRYGGRGISVCERWQTFDGFFADMGHPPEDLTLDRIDNDGNYEPNNCRWATQADQLRNRSITRLLTVNGETRTVREWETITGIPDSTIDGRLARGMSPADALCPDKFVNKSGLALGGKASAAKRMTKTHCKHGHPYDEANTRWENGRRACRACHRLKSARQAARKRDPRKTARRWAGR